MNKITYTNKYTKSTFLILITNLFEKLSYYGVRSLLILYITSDIVGMSRGEAFSLYGIFAGSLVFSGIIGGIIGDFTIGNKKASILGIILQTVGAFVMVSASINMVYLGIGLLSLGNGLYSPNINSFFGKQYYEKPKLLHSAFALITVSTSIGAVLGPVVIGGLGYDDFSIGFIAAGIIFLISSMFIIYIKEENVVKDESRKTDSAVYLYVISLILLVSIFWGVFEIGQTGINNLSHQSDNYEIISMLTGMGSSFLIGIGIVASIFWSFYYYRSIDKLIIGFVLGAASFALAYWGINDNFNVGLLMISYIVFSLAEIHISPIVYSVLTKYINPKYLAFSMGLALIPVQLSNYAVSLITGPTEDYTSLIKGSAIALLVIGLFSLLVFKGIGILKEKKLG